MTTGFFCDLHADEASSSQRDDKPKFDVKVTKVVSETNKRTGKKVKWSQDMNVITACNKDVTELIINRAMALGVEIEWSRRYRLGRDSNGKFFREIHPDDLTIEEKAQIDYETEMKPAAK